MSCRTVITRNLKVSSPGWDMTSTTEEKIKDTTGSTNVVAHRRSAGLSTATEVTTRNQLKICEVKHSGKSVSTVDNMPRRKALPEQHLPPPALTKMELINVPKQGNLEEARHISKKARYVNYSICLLFPLDKILFSLAAIRSLRRMQRKRQRNVSSQALSRIPLPRKPSWITSGMTTGMVRRKKISSSTSS
jgi:hypothetical protein